MRTWLVIYKEKGETKTQLIMAKTFDDAVYEVWNLMSLNCVVKGIFEVAK
jgi:hypothetical protein